MNCPHCHAANAANAKFCSACGKPLSPAAESSTSALPPQPVAKRTGSSLLRKLFNTYLTIAVIVAICGFIGYTTHPGPLPATSSQARNTPMMAVMKGAIWPVDLVMRVGMKHEPFLDWLLERNEPKK